MQKLYAVYRLVGNAILKSAIACELDLDVCHFDAEQALIQSKLDEDGTGVLSRYSRTFADELVKTFCVTSTQSFPLRVDVKDRVKKSSMRMKG